MTNLEFEQISYRITIGKEIKVRYFTYNKKEYIDIIGKISNLYGMGKTLFSANYYFTIEFIGIYQFHEKFNGKNFPNLKLYQIGDKIFCNLYSSNIIQMWDASIRAYKIHQLKNKTR